MKKFILLLLIAVASINSLLSEPLQYPMQAVYLPKINKYFVSQTNNKTMLLNENLKDAELYQIYSAFPIICADDNFLYAMYNNHIVSYSDYKPNLNTNFTIQVNANIKSAALIKNTPTNSIYAHFDNNKVYLLGILNALGLVQADEVPLNISSDSIISISSVGDNLLVSTVNIKNNSSNLYKYNVNSKLTNLLFTQNNDLTISGSATDKNDNIYIAFMGAGDNLGYIVRVNSDGSNKTIVANNLPVINHISYRGDIDYLVLSMNQNNEVRLLLAGKAPKVNLIFPAQAEELSDTKVSLRWAPVTGITNYNVKIAKDTLFVFGAKTFHTDKTNSDIILLDNNTKYYWKVQAVNYGIEGEWSEIRYFYSSKKKLEAPITLSPADNASDVPLLPKFVWTQSNPGFLYEFQISRQEDFSTLSVDGKNLSDTTLLLSKNLEGGAKYYWRVRTYSNLEYPSPWSAASAFTTIGLPPDPPAPEYPGYNEINVSLVPLFRWHSIDAASKYILQLSVDVNFEKQDSTYKFEIPAQSDLSTHTYKMQDSLTSFTHYYWRVKAATAKGETNWSEVRRFQTITFGTGGIEVSILSDNTVYPIPAANTLYINISDINLADYKLRVYNAAGAEIKNPEYSIIGNTVKINISEYEKGLYNVVFDSPKVIITKKFIKN